MDGKALSAWGAFLNPFISSVVIDILWTWSGQRFIVLLSPVAQYQGKMHVENWFLPFPF